MDHVLKNPAPGAPNPLSGFAVIRVPFFLEPDYDENKPYIETNRNRLIRKWGGPNGWETQKLRHNLKGRGLEAGISHFNLDRLTSNTMASHRLIQHLGKTYGLDVSEAIYDLLNIYYFVDGHSLNDRPRLAKAIADQLEKMLPQPPTEQEVLDFLNSNQGRHEIESTLAALHYLGIHGIPKFVIEGKTVVDGAAQMEEFVEIFRNIERRGHIQSGPIFTVMLGISDTTWMQGSHRRVDLVTK
jgi:predicted DsbA family dithiol-disulfide isomerase